MTLSPLSAARPLVLLAVLGVLAACQPEAEKAEAPPVRAVLSMVVSAEAPPLPKLAGTIQPRVQTPLGFRVFGRLVARDVATGDSVRAGETLAALDPTAFELAVRSARADLASAEATMVNAVAAEERMKTLLKTETETQARVESAELSREAAQASLVRARTALSKAEEQLSYTQIVAEFDGVVTATGAEVGQVVAAGDTVVTVARPDQRDAVIDVPDGTQPLAPDMSIVISLQINPDITATGTVREVAPSSDEATRTRRIKIAIENAPEAFRLGSTITASLQVPDEKKQIVVPSGAVFEADGKPSVWVIDETALTISARAVGVAPGEGGRTIITSGLEPGTRIATAGVNSLSAGETIRLTGEAAQ